MDYFYLSRKRVRFQLVSISKNTFTHQKNQILQFFTHQPKTAPKHSLSTFTHSKIHPHPYQNQNLIVSFLFLLIYNKEKRKIQAITVASTIWPRLKFCQYNFLLYHLHFLFFSTFIILVSSPCFHHPFKIIMHYYGIWLWQFKNWMP